MNGQLLQERLSAAIVWNGLAPADRINSILEIGAITGRYCKPSVYAYCDFADLPADLQADVTTLIEVMGA